jgi:hypothetical protein
MRRVHVVFKTHLDIGFTDLAERIVERYLDDFMPRAIALARNQRRSGGPRFVWTTGSWLPYIALERLRGVRRRAIEAALADGDLRWHALPFTMHCEAADAALIRRGLEMSQTLDRRFGRRTIAAKMTDVPGHTRGLVPLLAEAGVRLLHLGVNPASAMPDVPAVFRWACAGSEVAVMYAGAYGDIGQVPGAGDALAFAHAGDNHGPPSPAELAETYAGLAGRFPGACIEAGGMDEYAATLEPLWRELPVVGTEIGDTWIHGIGTDPGKLARLRALTRLHARWTAEGRSPRRVAAFGRDLLLAVEHTWGLDTKLHLLHLFDEGGPQADRLLWTNAAFRRARRLPGFRLMERSWAEQRAYLDTAISRLGSTPLANEARQAVADCAVRRPAPGGWHRLDDGAVTTGRWRFAVDSRDGAVIRLDDLSSGRRCADRTHRLAAFRYQTFSTRDYARYHAQYLRDTDRHAFWSLPDFGKCGMESAQPRSRLAGAAMVGMWQRRRSDATELRIRLRGDPTLVDAAGCPRSIEICWRLPDGDGEVLCELVWRGKRMTRLPEASWLGFSPLVDDPASWRLDKLGQAIDPLDVVTRGNRRLHGVGAGASCGGFALRTPDAGLIAPGSPGLLVFDQVQPDPAAGMWVNLHNNVWGTNFPMWYGEDARFRFLLRNDATG